MQFWWLFYNASSHKGFRWENYDKNTSRIAVWIWDRIQIMLSPNETVVMINKEFILTIFDNVVSAYNLSLWFFFCISLWLVIKYLKMIWKFVRHNFVIWHCNFHNDLFKWRCTSFLLECENSVCCEVMACIGYADLELCGRPWRNFLQCRCIVGM